MPADKVVAAQGFLHRYSLTTRSFSDKEGQSDMSKNNLIIPPSMGLSKLHQVMENYKELSENDNDRVLLLLGQTGVGKSSFVNYLLKQTVTAEAGGYLACTKDSGFWDAEVSDGHRLLRIVDTPGLFDPERNATRTDDSRYVIQECDRLMAEFERAFFLAGPELHAVGLLLNIGERFSLESQMMIEVLKRLKIDMSHVIIVFTHGDSLFNGGKLPDNPFEARYQVLEKLKQEENLPLGVMNLLGEVEQRIVIAEKYQPGEHDKVLETLLQKVEEIASNPIRNGRFDEERLAWKNSKKEREEKERERQLAQEQLTSARIRHQELEKQNLETKHQRSVKKKAELKQLYSKEEAHEEIREQHKSIRAEADQNVQVLAGLVADHCISRGKIEEYKRMQIVYLTKVSDLHKDMDEMYLSARDECVKPKLQKYIKSLKAICDHRQEGRIRFQEAAKVLDKYFKAEAAVRIAGTTAGVVGGVTAVIGIGLLAGVVTIPGGVVLLLGGVSIGTAGGAASVGASIADIVKKKKELKAAQEWILEGQKLVKKAVQGREELEEDLQKIRDVFPERSSQVLAACLNLDDVEEIEEFQKNWTSAENVLEAWKAVLQVSAVQVAEGMVAESSRQETVANGNNTDTNIADNQSQSVVDIGKGINASTFRTLVLGAGVAVGLSAGFTVVDILLLARISRKVHKRRWHTRLSDSLRSAADDFDTETAKIRGLASQKP